MSFIGLYIKHRYTEYMLNENVLVLPYFHHAKLRTPTNTLLYLVDLNI